VSRVDRTRSLYIGIAAGITALWSLYRVFWLFYAAATLSSIGYTSVSLAFSLVLWGAVTIVAGGRPNRSEGMHMSAQCPEAVNERTDRLLLP